MLIGCPLDFILPSAWEILEAARFAEKGHWPVAGGWLDQTQSCLNGVRMAWDFTNYWKNQP